MEEKQCTMCREKKPVSEFYQKKHGVYPWCKPCTATRNKEYNSRPEVHARRAAWARDQRLGRYGLTLESYAALLLKQKGKCAICKRDPASDRQFDVDHDHSCCPGSNSCGKCVRGLLCAKCNILVGYAEDDPRRLRRAAKYLEAS